MVTRSLPAIRARSVNAQPIRTDGRYVLYWMTAFRRHHSNFSLQSAVDYCRELGKPLVVLEALRCDYPWASDRLHQFVMDGMGDNYEFFSKHGITYHPYVEIKPNGSRGLLKSLAAEACVIVTDDFPCFFIPQMVARVGDKLPVRLEAVDSNGILPMRITDRPFTVAHSFRRYMQSEVIRQLDRSPEFNPIARLKKAKPVRLADDIRRRWPATCRTKMADGAFLAKLPIDHDVRVVPAFSGGPKAALRRLHEFVKGLEGYPDLRNQPQANATSRLSPYLHFGHIGAHQIFDAITSNEDWTADQVETKPNGKREGWWGASQAAEAFLDQLITWRELGFNTCVLRQDYDRYESLPDWAQKTLADHVADRREYLYDPADFEFSQTHDPLWNAAQRQLVQEGVIHNYLRMLWGKKILQWTPNARTALDVMIELNNKYALDGRDPNSYSGVFWCLGRYDRAWGPERPVFGKIRYMTSENTRRKVDVKDYLKQYARPS